MSFETVLEIQGGHQLNGTVHISGAKNAILPLMAATVLTDKPVTFSNVPKISDVDAMGRLLRSHGVSVDVDPNQVTCTATYQPQSESNGPTISREFRASTLLLGPLLARCGSATIYLPGGDNIDSQGRPVDIHVTNLRKLGAIVDTTNPDCIKAHAPYGLKGPGVRQPIVLPKVSVGATQNTIMAACAATGTTVIEKASVEPETLDLVKMLNSMNANIRVDKKKQKITITGKDIQSFMKKNQWEQSCICHTVIPDRIEAGTYAIAAVITGGSIELRMGNFSDEVILELLESEFWRFLAAGVDITRTENGVRISRKRTCTGQLEPILPVNVKTKPYPGFPTDLHPQWAALMCFSNGESWIEETVFDSRFKYVEKLQQLGAKIMCDPVNRKRVNVFGNLTNLRDLQQPAVRVEADDIRAGAALILTALGRNGTTQIRGLQHIERGYEDFVNKFTNCGAVMEKKLAWV